MVGADRFTFTAIEAFHVVIPVEPAIPENQGSKWANFDTFSAPITFVCI